MLITFSGSEAHVRRAAGPAKESQKVVTPGSRAEVELAMVALSDASVTSASPPVKTPAVSKPGSKRKSGMDAAAVEVFSTPPKPKRIAAAEAPSPARTEEAQVPPGTLPNPELKPTAEEAQVLAGTLPNPELKPTAEEAQVLKSRCGAEEKGPGGFHWGLHCRHFRPPSTRTCPEKDESFEGGGRSSLRQILLWVPGLNL